ncbi:CU044_5270 family protein [Patulibacter sp. S7RM1-6]
MPEPTDDLHALPILADLGAELDRAFRQHEGRRVPPATGRAPRSAGRRRRRFALAGTGCTALALAIAIVIGAGGSGRPATADAAVLLRRAAERAANHLDPVLPPPASRYWYRDELVLDAVIDGDDGRSGRAAWSFTVTRRRTWTSVTRQGTLLSRTVAAPRPGALPPRLRRDALDDRAVPAPRLRPGTAPDTGGWSRTRLGADRYAVGGESLTPSQLREFPTAPAEIEERMRRSISGMGRSPDGELWTTINDALRDAPLPSAVAAGMYRVLAHLPGVSVGRETTDLLGRPALAISYREPGSWERRTLLLRPGTYERLGDRTEVASAAAPVAGHPTEATGTTAPRAEDPEPPFPTGTVLGESLALDSRPVDAAPESPPTG